MAKLQQQNLQNLSPTTYSAIPMTAGVAKNQAMARKRLARHFPIWFRAVLLLAVIVTVADLVLTIRRNLYGDPPTKLATWEMGKDYRLIAPPKNYVLRVETLQFMTKFRLSVHNVKLDTQWSSVFTGIYRVNFTPDGKKILMSGQSPRVIDSETGKILWSNGLNREPVYFDETGSIAYLVDEKKNQVTVWDTEKNREKIKFLLDTPRRHIQVRRNSNGFPFAFDPGGRFFASTAFDPKDTQSYSNMIFVRDLTTKKPFYLPQVGTFRPETFSPDGKKLLILRTGSITPSQDAIQCLDMRSQKPVWTATSSGRAAFFADALAWSADSRYVAVATAQTVELRDGVTGRSVYRFVRTSETAGTSRLWFSQDRKTLYEITRAINSDHAEETLQRWDLSRALQK